MKASVVEFKLFEDIFCFNTELIEYVFELEEFNKVNGFHEAVVGVTKYNKDVMLLVDTAKLYSNKDLDFQKPLSVIVIQDEAKRVYGMVVDEIIKLEELESVNASLELNSDEMRINHYKEADEIINEIYPLPLLKKYAIPSMAALIVGDATVKMQEEELAVNYLLFKIADSSYAIDSTYVREVLENDTELFSLNDQDHYIKGAIAVRDEVIRVVELKEAKEANDIVVVELGNKKIAIVVDEVYDIENFVDSKIEWMSGSKSSIGAFYNYKNSVVAILDPNFYFQEMESQVEETRQEESASVLHTKYDYLIFMIDGKKYSIEMQCVRQVLETDSLAKTQSSSIVASDDIEFIATWNKHAVNIINFKNLLNLESNNDNTSQTIIIEHDGHLVAFMVEDIDNIAYLDSGEISQIAAETNSLINGAIVYENEVIVTLNAAFLANIG